MPGNGQTRVLKMMGENTYAGAHLILLVTHGRAGSGGTITEACVRVLCNALVGFLGCTAGHLVDLVGGGIDSIPGDLSD